MLRLVRLLTSGVLLLCGVLSVAAQDNADDILPITEDVVYTVRPSDTLDAVGALFDVSPVCIAANNDISRYDFLQIGQELLISVACPRYAEDPSYLATNTVLIPREVVEIADCDGVRVAGSDTVASLARILGVTEEALREANNFDADEAPIFGTCITIPAPEDDTAGAGGGGAREGTFYVVGFGDTLNTIGLELNVSAVSLQIANQVTDVRQLLAGTTLFIPADAPPFGEYPPLTYADSLEFIAGEDYVIQPNDTLDVIAQRFDKSLQAILLANNITNTIELMPGTVIIIPDDAPPYGQFPALELFTTPAGISYTVQTGETLDDVAQEFDVALVALETANGIASGANVLPGTEIIIPANVPQYGADEDFDASMLSGQGGGGTGGLVHVVQPRDTIDSIAAEYGISRDCLLETNELELADARFIQPGTSLAIDTSCPPYLGYNIPPLSSAIEPAGN